jgi:hypothetical protein
LCLRIAHQIRSRPDKFTITAPVKPADDLPQLLWRFPLLRRLTVPRNDTMMWRTRSRTRCPGIPTLDHPHAILKGSAPKRRSLPPRPSPLALNPQDRRAEEGQDNGGAWQRSRRRIGRPGIWSGLA